MLTKEITLTMTENFENIFSSLKTDEPKWYRDWRRNEFECFSKTGIPTTQNEEWKYTNVTPLATKSFYCPENPATAAGLGHYLNPDEINIVLRDKYISFPEFKKVLDEKPKDMEVVLTGRGAPQALIDVSDLVTEMKEIKHPFKQGLKVRKGIEY